MRSVYPKSSYLLVDETSRKSALPTRQARKGDINVSYVRVDILRHLVQSVHPRVVGGTWGPDTRILYIYVVGRGSCSSHVRHST